MRPEQLVGQRLKVNRSKDGVTVPPPNRHRNGMVSVLCHTPPKPRRTQKSHISAPASEALRALQSRQHDSQAQGRRIPGADGIETGLQVAGEVLEDPSRSRQLVGDGNSSIWSPHRATRSVTHGLSSSVAAPSIHPSHRTRSRQGGHAYRHLAGRRRCRSPESGPDVGLSGRRRPARCPRWPPLCRALRPVAESTRFSALLVGDFAPTVVVVERR